ncbi:MAG: class I SAM-dependent methyltransferase [Ectothiorhodospiraceae bacterium]|nr:class I SAM-dependent methyltransferase [Chromatiales bacterium]MCP5155635.1 class I SAM-dependent methyltransferase [Ectothiorhodospiraceae bacterium]
MIDLARTFYRLARTLWGLRAFSASERARFVELVVPLMEGVGGGVPAPRAYHLAETLSTAIYPHFKFSEFGRSWLDDAAFVDCYRRFMDPGNWHSLDRKYTLDQLLRLALRVPGDCAECGVYTGMSSYLICRRLAAAGGSSPRHHHAFDSFEGLSAPDDRDGDYWQAGAMAVSEQAVHAALAEFDNYTTHRGWIPERFADVADRQFAFVHVDVDLYQPTLDSLAFFYPRLAAGGVILMDDYGFDSCPGARAAADEYFATVGEPVVELTTGQAMVLKQPTP